MTELDGIAPDVVNRFHLDRLPFHQARSSLDELTRLTGTRVVVTGGGGADLGQAVVHRFASLGARVTALDVDLAAARHVAEEAANRWDAEVFALQADVTDWDDVHATVGRAAELMGGLDVVINNAGGGLKLHGPFSALEPDGMRRLVDLNLVGVLYSTRAALDHMLAQDSGRIITIASEGGKISLDGLAVYNACKSAAIGFTRNLARELRDTGVGVVAVCPGVMVGPHALSRLAGNGSAASISALEQSFDRLTAGRFSLPEEVANMVAFLAGEAGAYVDGTAVSVGGGLSD
ncbi:MULTISPECIES: SDR family NAD(P)-dependent oxidoreductase [Pseudonocardia]|uniref:Diacetyl reductase [(S)-acetoin forming] n=2 Tax=Pseudonocardia TaxID=1847 RepID=A0A1Y2N0U7_PSEAH|nr:MULTISPECIES: SDR family oxidoreductase [Pseudonocardia]OSY40789.1 Diacetyl reductase [(S)-acetoin forming] [Pseudonocardia autotrophica]TDN71904.1 3-oxoacyl-[acyl-carrier protein] reductase [Pseudonocardia autotrophica]BBG02592.1 acetoin reductase [Pseudonocardia autotrophica]GEC24651.1 acetoin reductase [Pseudonocardia saturnea]